MQALRRFKSNIKFRFCRALFHYRLAIKGYDLLSHLPKVCMLSCSWALGLYFCIITQVKQFNHAPIKLHVCETEPGKGNFLTTIGVKLERSIDITWSWPIYYSEEVIGQIVLHLLLLSHRCSTICFCSFWHRAIRCSVLSLWFRYRVKLVGSAFTSQRRQVWNSWRKISRRLKKPNTRLYFADICFQVWHFIKQQIHSLKPQIHMFTVGWGSLFS